MQDLESEIELVFLATDCQRRGSRRPRLPLRRRRVQPAEDACGAFTAVKSELDVQRSSPESNFHLTRFVERHFRDCFGMTTMPSRWPVISAQLLREVKRFTGGWDHITKVPKRWRPNGHRFEHNPVFSWASCWCSLFVQLAMRRHRQPGFARVTGTWSGK